MSGGKIIRGQAVFPLLGWESDLSLSAGALLQDEKSALTWLCWGILHPRLLLQLSLSSSMDMNQLKQLKSFLGYILGSNEELWSAQMPEAGKIPVETATVRVKTIITLTAVPQ